MIYTLVSRWKRFCNSFGTAEGHPFPDGADLVCPYVYTIITVFVYIRMHFGLCVSYV